MEKHNVTHKPFYEHENLVFLKRALHNPKSLGAIAPSSKALSELMVRHTYTHESGYIVEVGAGTGACTRQLIKSGISHDRIIVVELDLELCHYLRMQFPSLTIVHGDATQLNRLLPHHMLGKIDTIISGIPLINLSKETRTSLIHAFKDVLSPKGKILQFTYGPISPIRPAAFGLHAQRVGAVLFNVPPATVWAYTAQHNTHSNKHTRIKRYVKVATHHAQQTFKRIMRQPH